jgi:hypothetical protein
MEQGNDFERRIRVGGCRAGEGGRGRRHGGREVGGVPARGGGQAGFFGRDSMGTISISARFLAAQSAGR